MMNFTRTHKIVILIVAIVMTVGFGYKTVVDDTNEIEINDDNLFLETDIQTNEDVEKKIKTNNKKEQNEELNSEEKTLYAEENTAKEVVVHITGEVVRPGIVSLQSGGRVIDAIKKAGGLTPYADEKSINLAQKLIDEDKVIIPSRDESSQVETPAVSPNQSSTLETGQAVSTGNSGVVSKSPQSQGSDSSGGGGGQVNINTASKEELKTLSGVGDVTAQKIMDYRESTPFGAIEDLKQVSGIGDKKFDAIKNMITTR